MNLNHYIDHTLLKADALSDQIRALCDEAREYQFASVCVNSTHTALVHECLKGSDVKTCVVVGFPLGAMHTKAKEAETAVACELGAREIDMVINIGALKEGRDSEVREDIAAVVTMAHRDQALVKVIIETCLLTDEEKKRACQLSVEAGADFVKTSTGFSTGGATLEDVRLMKAAVGGKAKVKASGGVRNLEQAMAMIEAGADRLGTSNGIAIIQGQQTSSDY